MEAIEDLNDIQKELVQPGSTDQSGSAANQNNPASASRGIAPTLFNVEGKICTSSFIYFIYLFISFAILQYTKL